MLLLIAAATAGSPSVGLSQTITTNVGTGSQGSGVGATGITTSLDLPGAVHVDPFGLYIADTGNNRILFVDEASGVPAVIAGTGVAGFSGDGAAASLAQLNAPIGVFVTPSGNIYVADSGNHRIRLIANGNITTIAGTGEAGASGDNGAAIEAQLSAPTQLFVTGNGDSVFVADTGNHRIRVITGSTISTVAGTGTAGFFGDDSLAVKAQLDGPSGVFSDSTSGRLYIADTNNHRIRYVSSDRKMHALAGSSLPNYGGDGGAPEDAGLAFPRGLFADAEGNLYVADTFNQRVRRINARGNVTTITGDGIFGYAGDGGPANHAQVRSPVDVTVDSLGQILIADRDNHRIRRIDPDNSAVQAGIVGPQRETQLFSIAFTGDGTSSVDSLTLTVLGVPGDLDVAENFVEFRLFESTDATLDTSGVADELVGSIGGSDVTLGAPFTIELESPSTPASGVERHYLVSALVETTATEHDSIWASFATGDLLTSTGGRGMARANSDTMGVLEIDVVATHLTFATQPAGSISGIALSVVPVVEARDDLSFLDADFDDTITLTTNAPGTLQFNTATAVNAVATFPNLTYFPTADEESFSLTADDETTGAEGDLATVSSDVITSSSVNDPPVVAITPFTMFEDATSIRQVSEFVTDVDDTELTIQVTSDHLQIAVDGGEITLVPEADFSGEASLTISAEDAFGAQSQATATIEIIAVNDPPVLTVPQSLTISEDDSLELDLSARTEDPDDDFGDLEFLITPSVDLISDFNEDTGVLRLWTAPDSSGSFTVIIAVNDDLSTAVDTMEVEILDIDDPPQIVVLSPLFLEAGSGTQLGLDTLVTDDSDVGLITWNVLAGSGLSVSVDAQERTVIINPIPGFIGASSLVFTATDAQNGADSENVDVLVLAPGEEPPAPQLTADFDSSGRVDLEDFFLFADAFGSTDESLGWDSAFDLDASQIVDFDDFFLFADAFGTTVE